VANGNDTFSPIKFREKLAEQLLATKVAAYTEITRIINVIEDKAQKAALSSGALLALGVPFLSKGDPNSPIKGSVSVILFLAVLMFVGSFSCCLWVMWAREVAAPPQFGELQKLANELLLLDDSELKEDRPRRYLMNQSDCWETALAAHQVRAEKKVNTLRWAQGLLAAGIFVLAAMLLILLGGNFL
jgi:hypothetical protein